MKILKSVTGQTKKVLLRENGQVDVLSYNDDTNNFDIDYSVYGGICEYEMQVFFNIN